MGRPIHDQVVVITGASSGIGRATAIEFGRQEACVVLAARGEEALRAAAAEVEGAGGQAEVVVTDVSDWGAVQWLARRAVDRFGHVDTWINVAAVADYGTVDETPIEEQRRLVEVNLIGVMHGVKAALPLLRESGGGLIVNVASVLGTGPAPYLAAYTATKFGVRGYSDALRIELAREAESGGPRIHVTTINPSSINTPFFEHARSRLGQLPQPMPPAYQPEVAARAIVAVAAADHPPAEVIVGGAGKAFELAYRLSPRLLALVERAGGMMFRAQESGQPDDGVDNLFAPMPGPGRVHGRFDRMAFGSSVYTEAVALRPAPLKALAVGTVALGALGLFAMVSARPNRRRRRPRFRR
jgi:short-subunit dehydrogenase